MTAPPQPLPTQESPLLGVTEMQALVLGGLSAVTTERVDLSHAAGRVLARSVVSERHLPGVDNSAMDGFAVRSADCVSPGDAEARLRVDGEARAGDAVTDHLPGTAMRIMTGAPLPRGADSVVPWEDTDEVGGAISIRVTVRSGAHVRRCGEDISPGMTVVEAGRRLRPIDVAACAAVGAAALEVRRRPRVAIVSGGDELVAPEVVPEPHQVVDSNAVMLAAAVEEAGGEAVRFGVVADDPDALRERFIAAAACDLIVSSAGVSVGAHDHVRGIVEELGSITAWRVAMRPGKPLLVGAVCGTPLLGLPGNPVSSAVTFELFGRPAILALQGATSVHRGRIAVRLAEAVRAPEHLETYLRARLVESVDGIPTAELSGGQGSHMLRSLADADVLVCVPQGAGSCAAGTVLRALML
ncbi:MAG: gephyrin-like molybdotransferase Glp [Candidatus Dormibacteria bacterium]